MAKKKRKSDLIQSWLPRLNRLYEAGDRISDLRIKVLEEAIKDELPVVIGIKKRNYYPWIGKNGEKQWKTSKNI